MMSRCCSPVQDAVRAAAAAEWRENGRRRLIGTTYGGRLLPSFLPTKVGVQFIRRFGQGVGCGHRAHPSVYSRNLACVTHVAVRAGVGNLGHPTGGFVGIRVMV